MYSSYDYVNKVQFVEWLGELVGVKVGIAPTRDQLQAVINEVLQTNAARVTPNMHPKRVKQIVGYGTLERYGLKGAQDILYKDITLAVKERVGNLTLAIQAIAFVVGRVIGPSAERETLLSAKASPFGNFPYALMEVISEQQQKEIISEATTLRGEALGDAVTIALAEFNLRIGGNIVFFRNETLWNEPIALIDLFESEELLTPYGRFFDQRFINYLANNLDDIPKMHWRKFEGVAAEYFHRRGFKVEIGPGRNDDGIDVRAWSSQADTSSEPPLLIVQCKREKRKVEKVVVKALAGDVAWEGARRGLLVASSEWSPGARNVVKTRNYPVSEVNVNAVKKWLVQMRDHDKGMWIAD